MIISFRYIKSHNVDLESTTIIIQAYDNININGIINLGLQAVFIKFRSDILTFLYKIAQNMNMDKYMIETISLVENISM